MDVVGLCTDPAANRPESPEREPSLEVPTRDGNTRLGRLRRFVDTCRENIWFPVALRATAIFLGMVGLATVASVSILSGRGVHLDADNRTLANSTQSVLTTAWLKPAPEPPPTDPSAASLGPKAARGAATGSALAHPHDDSQPKAPPTGITADGKVVLNEATAEQLIRLPGVGAKRAAAILKLRKRLKRFRRVSDLLRVRGIGIKSLRRLKPLIVLDAPKEEPPKEKKTSGADSKPKKTEK